MKKYMMLLLIVACLIPLVSAASFGTKQQGTCVDFKIGCGNCTWMNISSIEYVPNSTQLVGEIAMTQTGTVYNYTFCDTNAVGEYHIISHGDVDGIDTPVGNSLEINPQGIPATDQRTGTLNLGVWVLFVVAVLLFVGFLFYKSTKPVKWTLFVFSIVFFVAALNLVSINIADSVVNPSIQSFFDSFTAIAFYFYWFAAGLLGIIWIFGAIGTWVYKKNKRNAEIYGIG